MHKRENHVYILDVVVAIVVVVDDDVEYLHLSIVNCTKQRSAFCDSNNNEPLDWKKYSLVLTLRNYF